MTTPGDAEYFARMRRLADFLTELPRRPSDRALGMTVGVRSSTIDAWLRKRQFPRQIDDCVKLVEAIRKAAIDRGKDPRGQADLLDAEQWRNACRAEAASS